MATTAIAFAANAATYSWATYTGQYVYQAGTSDKLAGVTAYLFDTSAVAQADLVDGILNGGKTFSDFTSLSSTSTSTSGSIAKKEFDAGNSVNVYFAVLNGDDIYVSSVLSGSGSEVGTTALSFRGTSNASKAAAIQWEGASSLATAGGWYTAAPEPTSGLLLLLGMAGLALKRKHV